MRYVDTVCALCCTPQNSVEIFPEYLDLKGATSSIFSARRLPDRRSYRWVKCKSCGLYRSDPVLDLNLSELYRDSTFDYGHEVAGLKKTYRRLVKKALRPHKPFGHILEIGGGNGFFLEEAFEMGFTSIEGVEPSQSAVDSAPPKIRKAMKVSMFDEQSVRDSSANVIVIFHTLDHLERPVEVLRVALKKLVKGGSIIIAVHNVEAFSARLLKSRSPIFDIEHTYLFSRNSLKECLQNAGFHDIRVGSYSNYYSLAYLVHLFPIPQRVKLKLLNSSVGRLLVKVRVWIPLGNIYASGKRK